MLMMHSHIQLYRVYRIFSEALGPIMGERLAYDYGRSHLDGSQQDIDTMNTYFIRALNICEDKRK